MFKNKIPPLLILILIGITLLPINPTDGANILFVVTIASHSVRVALQPLIDALADRNHEVTVFSTIPPFTPNPKVKEFCTQGLLNMNNQMQNDKSTETALGRVRDRHFDPFWKDKFLLDLLVIYSEIALRDPEFTNWMENKTFDLIINDALGKEFIYPFAHKMNAKVISFTTFGTLFPYEADLWGIPAESWFPDVVGNKHSWLPDRFSNTFNPLDWFRYHNLNYLPKIEALCRETLNFDFPPLEDLLIDQTSLVFLNEHFTSGFPKAYPPFVVPMGGMHVTEYKSLNKTLPKDLENFIADVEEFVFISFGSIITVSKLPKAMQQTMFDAVASFRNTRFFWKWEGDLPENLPKNVLAKKWFPQQEVLAHRKCKAFITQGGAMSQFEAIFHAVPVIIVPGFGDQSFVAKAATHHGYGIQLELADITKETFTEAIHQILRNTKYLTTVKEVSRRFKDRPLSPLDTAVWWTEYVLRHDTSHLKSEAMRQSWWTRRSLDFWLLIFMASCVLISVSLALALFIVKIISKTLPNKTKEKKM